MTYEDIASMLNSTDLPVAYNSFPIGNVPPLPYIVYSFPNSENFGADNYAYQKGTQLRMWLCVAEKDFATENILESVLDANKIFYDKTESFEQSDSMYMILYESEIILTDGE